MIRPALIVLVAGLAFVASGCGGERSSSASGPTAPEARTLTDLHEIGTLRTAFAKASKRPRLIILVSPT